ncbi:ribosome silencing factor [Candidatus Lucifugimonas marina]|jgi:ribosome-associated protein|uniref:Ribosomal silencing factor RsfS n=1 Tax=Candidatus Lucifugimonas marina TaxID=3038979 RepID=A0AAJ5ZG60_9CHLR|nr:ribosome silencing factor [SAR202 cluster bacterium JH702]MDG0868935.1 ribosome silencing factor [SAR202 cluster bacterium JH639]WFG35562.1 ribosome silencing factor [SAR202 cluster bacterium JH545]WFG39509.1 ribosome silencing factor [SAR202 cluster bacterium JH1073]
MEDTTKTKTVANNEEIARAAVDEASEKLGSDIVLLETEGISSFADYFVIISGETDRHLESMAEDISRRSRKMGVHVTHREGSGKGGWLLIDFTGVVVHLFTRDQREHYGLEDLWTRATEIVRVQ